MSPKIKRNSLKGINRLSNRKKLRVTLISMLTIVSVVFTVIFAGYLHVKNRIYTSSESKSSNSDESVNYTEVKGISNVLLIGTDGRTLDEQSRADSMIIATLDSNNKKVKLTSLFRDTLVDIPGYGESKLNSAFMNGGPELLMETVQKTYNIKVDKYVIINFWGFEAIIDQIGGLEIDVKDFQLEELNKYIGESTSGNDCPVTEPGLQLLNGKQALSYARIRYNVGDDYGRTERQREVLFKVAEKLKVTKPSRYPGVMNKMLEYIRTNIDPIEALNMAYTIYKFPTLKTEQLQMPVTELSESRLYKDLGSVILIDKEQNAEVLRRFIFEDKLPDPESFDYNSLSSKLAEYAAQEASYNNMYGIDPKAYEEIYEPIVVTDKENEENESSNKQTETNIEEKEVDVEEEETKVKEPIQQETPKEEKTSTGENPTTEEKPVEKPSTSNNTNEAESTTSGSSGQQ